MIVVASNKLAIAIRDRYPVAPLHSLVIPRRHASTTPEFTGVVSRVAADLTKDQKDSQAYFEARVALSDEALQHLGKLKLVLGMPAEVHIKTTERTAFSYLIKPLRDQVARAFRSNKSPGYRTLDLRFGPLTRSPVAVAHIWHYPDPAVQRATLGRFLGYYYYTYVDA